MKPARTLSQMTGSRRVPVRPGFSEFEAYGEGLACVALGCLDAPDLIPQGSVRLHNTPILAPSLSIGHRDGDDRPLGAPHDGPEPVPPTLTLHAGEAGDLSVEHEEGARRRVRP
jgi:hypothetical protein